MPLNVPYIRIFLSSPGDVAEERKIAMDVIENLPYRPVFRDRVAFRIIAWDKLGANTPMLGSLTPQEAINRGLPRPRDCDITIAILWKRMGTPFVDNDGRSYRSGTHWEIMDALANPRCETLIYRREDEVSFGIGESEAKDQYERLEEFFSSDVFFDQEGHILRGYNAYTLPEDFRVRLQSHLEEVVLRLLEQIEASGMTPDDLEDFDPKAVVTAEARAWPAGKSPFPGLRSFTPDDAEIFFGRGYETDRLMRHVANNRFVAVVGASGSGKSSLIGAGLIPRLRANAISDENTGSKDWLVARFTPGWSSNPFEALADALIDSVPALACDDPIEYGDHIDKLTSSLQKAPDRLAKIVLHALRQEQEWVELLIFIDQFEELFTLVDEDHILPFVKSIAHVAQKVRDTSRNRVRVVVTLRADFYHRAVQLADLSDLLRDGSFPLAAPRRDALRQMVERPAERAGVTWEVSLVDRILQDTGEEAGNLALMAYALDELYKLAERRHDKRITFEDYDRLNGVRGAIGVRAENVFYKLNTDESLLHDVFRRLVDVDEHGTATRRRAHHTPDEMDSAALELIDALVDARLLVTDYDPELELKTVEVAHEAILREWDRLSSWIDDSQEYIFRLRQLRESVKEWLHHHRADAFLWSVEQVHLAVDALENLRMQPDDDTQQFLTMALTPDAIPDFIEPPSADTLLPMLTDSSESPRRRQWAGIWLSHFGDPRPGVGVDDEGLPHVVWCDVPAGPASVPLSEDEVEVSAFRIAMYPITTRQFAAFVDTPSLRDDGRWWQGLVSEHGAPPRVFRIPWFPHNSHPRDSVSWVQAVAFCRWLDSEYRHRGWLGEGEQLRLPTEWEWERAALGDRRDDQYPYGQRYDPNRANTASSLGMTSAVGMYPHGVSPCGAHDMSGNVWEWCANKYFDLTAYAFDIQSQRALRGGAWASPVEQATAQRRWRLSPDDWSYWAGFRVCIAPPLQEGQLVPTVDTPPAAARRHD